MIADDWQAGPAVHLPGEDADLGAVPSLGWRGSAMVVAFWTCFGAVMAASLVFSDLPRSGDATWQGLALFSFLGAYAWAGLTPPLFHLTRRLDLTGSPASWRGVRVAGLMVIGLVLSALVAVAVALLTLWMFDDLFAGGLAGPEGLVTMVRYRIPHDLLACLLVLTSGVARDYFIRYRSRLAEATLLRSQLAEARLQVLRTQLNPHFLFNTLNAVAALVQTDPRGVRRMIALLSEMLRETLDGASETEIPLEKELAQLRRYLAIMEIRFRDRLEVRIETDTEVLDAMVPNLVLQPLVENALKHGIGPGSTAGFVQIAASREGDELVLAVRDSGHGSGLEGETQAGFGLRHTRERIQALYGERSGLRLVSLEDGETLAEIRIPFHTDGSEPTSRPSDTARSKPAAHPPAMR